MVFKLPFSPSLFLPGCVAAAMHAHTSLTGVLHCTVACIVSAPMSKEKQMALFFLNNLSSTHPPRKTKQNKTKQQKKKTKNKNNKQQNHQTGDLLGNIFIATSNPQSVLIQNLQSHLLNYCWSRMSPIALLPYTKHFCCCTRTLTLWAKKEVHKLQAWSNCLNCSSYPINELRLWTEQ